MSVSDVHANSLRDCQAYVRSFFTIADDGAVRDLHANERGQTRYTISPTFRRELLRRLLELNIEIASRENLQTGTRTQHA